MLYFSVYLRGVFYHLYTLCSCKDSANERMKARLHAQRVQPILIRNK